ncbi:centromere protein H (CENP-H)-domain-containing protein [Aspergillus unguis]
MSSTGAQSLPQLGAGEVTLLDLAADDSRDTVSFSDKEAAIIQLFHQIQEQEIEQAFLRQELESSSSNNDEDLATAERELLDARATYTVRKKAANTVLITDPVLKAVHLKGQSPSERALLRLINRRDILSLAQENLTEAHTSTMKKLSTLEVENLRLHQTNQGLARELLELTKDDDSWKEKLDDPELEQQLAQLETEHNTSKAKWELMKGVASAIIVGSGVNWADDEDLTALVLDESND